MKARLGKRAAQAVAGMLAVAAVLVASWLVLSAGESAREQTGESAHESHAAGAGSATAATTASGRTEVIVDPETMERLGITFAPVLREAIGSAARHPATVVADESRVSHVHARVSGWVEELFVNTTGAPVRRGQPVAGIFSQELFASQAEYLALLERSRGAPSSAALEAARVRLAVLGMSDADIRALEGQTVARRLVTVAAPRDGVVLRRSVSIGTAIDPSTELMTIVDLKQVWVLAEVPEAYAQGIDPGTAATLEFPGAGNEPLAATVDFVYPTVTDRTRSVRARFVVPNANGALRPGMYGAASFDAADHEALTVPREAVVETGESQHVFVRTTEGGLEPRPVRLGRRLPDRLEVLEGLSAGDEVVSSGVFVIDSESRLRASSGGSGHAGHAPPP
jgi:Cu(I)/Ag(I) efflux system membrane fusion protein